MRADTAKMLVLASAVLALGVAMVDGMPRAPMGRLSSHFRGYREVRKKASTVPFCFTPDWLLTLFTHVLEI